MRLVDTDKCVIYYVFKTIKGASNGKHSYSKHGHILWQYYRAIQPDTDPLGLKIEGLWPDSKTMVYACLY